MYKKKEMQQLQGRKPSELYTLLGEQTQEMQKLKFSLLFGKQKSSAKLGQIRKARAQILTLLRKKFVEEE